MDALMDVVTLSRLQFAFTAMFHFLFVPLTLGMSFLLAIMESLYVITGKILFKQMTQFWGKLFGINFALGVTTGLIFEFQFGTNWSYYSHYVGDVFGAPLALEGLTAFFMESTFVGMFFFGWERLSRVQHLLATWLVAFGSSMSALWILLANGWMQNPVGAEFNPDTMRMEMHSFADVVFNPVAQVKFVHTAAAGYTTGALFVMAVSAWYLLKNRHLQFARMSYIVAASFGMAAITATVLLGDESGYEMGDVQKTKLAAIEAVWQTQPAPASFTLFGLPDQAAQTNHYAVEIPWLMGLIATRSLTKPVVGIDRLMEEHEARIRNGVLAWSLLKRLQQHPGAPAPALRSEFDRLKKDLGYGLLLKRYRDDISLATEAEIKQATKDSIPQVAPLYFAFRIMVFCGSALFLIMLLSFWSVIRGRPGEKRWLLRAALYGLPLPWLAMESGWFVSEYGRQPWAIGEILPTLVASSELSRADVWFSMILVCSLYTLFFIAELFLMFKFARKGPGEISA